MKFTAMSDNAILKEIGARIKTLRLNRNISQMTLADSAQLSVGTVKTLEKGQGKLSSLVAVLRELDALERVESLLPETRISPQQLLKMQGRQRKRASTTSGNSPAKEKSKW